MQAAYVVRSVSLVDGLARSSYSLKLSKTKIVYRARGAGVVSRTRRLQAEGFGADGEVVAQARYLGAQLRADDSAECEVRMRLEAMTKAWRQTGDIWDHRWPRRVLRTFFLGLIVNTLASGLDPGAVARPERCG